MLFVVAIVAVQFAGVAAAGHGSPANFTVYPETTEDRSPSTTTGNYVMSSAGADAFDSERGLKYVDFYWIESDQASFTGCNPDNARTFGIDRGNNNTGTQTDVDLLEHMKNYNVGDNRITLELFDEGDFGGDPINLNAPDATIAVLADCVENTGDPGWYQFQGYVNGTTYDDSYEEVYLDSHYFWIGDFESEAGAREELGPPPSEDGPSDGNGDSDGSTGEGTTEQEATPTRTDDSSDENGDDGAESTSEEGSSQTGTPAPTSTDAVNDEGSDGGSTAEDSTADGQDAGANSAGANGQSTPTPGDGPGFGALVTVFALLSAALLTRRW
ncbi:PGF-CTERM sorting domain-containing protein [Natronomonas salina]|uniref:PGF-CTERM sorting domain-containing protein n=1 Tax=Natronomonas salina TaxID=1710540 RepID=UPI0015B422CB|nr:PGF-CTERM sorting domain-containing protein [Natronomonas salina]QLD88093.1 PGF-CTERM sorting domain-containing protein [Natronomonas salina]